MKRKWLSAFMSITMISSAVAALTPNVLAAPVDGVEYSIDFSTWDLGTYTIDKLNTAANGTGITISDAYSDNDAVTYSVVYDESLNKNVLKMTSSSSAADGLFFTLPNAISGKNVTYYINNKTDSTMDSYGVNNKYLMASDMTGAVTKGAIMKGKIQLNHNNGWINPDAGYTANGWIKEELVVNPTSKQYLYLTDKKGHVSYNDSFLLTSNGNKSIYTSKIYMGRAMSGYISEIGFRTYPIVIDSGVYNGDEEYTDTTSVSANSAVKFVFDHNMDETTFTTDNVKLYNITEEKYETLSSSDIEYDSASFALTVSTKNLKKSTQYRVELGSGIANTDNIALKPAQISFQTEEGASDYYFNGFGGLNATAGTMLNAEDLNIEGSPVTITAMNTDHDGIFEVVEEDSNKSIKVTQSGYTGDAYGIKMNFDKDLFTALGTQNIVAELDYYVDNTTLSTYAALGRMNNTSCLYINNGNLMQQGSPNLELKTGLNGERVHYKWVMNSQGTMNVYANGERLSYDGSYDIPFRNSANKPTVWEIYIQKSDTYYIIDNLRIRNYPEAMLSFKDEAKTSYESKNVNPEAAIYVTFDNVMDEDVITSDKFGLYNEAGEKVGCTVSKYDASEQQVALIPDAELDMGKTYEIRIDDSIVNAQGKELASNVLSFTTLMIDPITIEDVNVTDYNKLEVEFSGYVDANTISKSDFNLDGFNVSSVSIARNPENYAKHKAEITVDGVLNIGSGKVVMTGGCDEEGRSLAGLEGEYTAEDKLYVNSVDFSLEGSSTEPKISIAVLGGSKISGAAVIGTYYENGSDLKSLNFNEYNNIEAGKVMQVSSGVIDTTAGDNGDSGCVKVFVWDSMSTLKPLCDTIRVMKQITIHLAGDSKVCEYYEASYPQQGWGHYLSDYLIDSASINNKAQSGTTTTTFRTGKIITDSENPDEIVYSDYKPWNEILKTLSAGDYVIIDLAHNDKYSTNSGANDIEAYKENIRGYVDEIINEHNAIPILMSTVPHVRVTTNELADYGAAMRVVAQEKGTIFLDVNAAAFAEFEELGIETARNKFYLSNWALKNVYNMSNEDISNALNSSLRNRRL